MTAARRSSSGLPAIIITAIIIGVVVAVFVRGGRKETPVPTTRPAVPGPAEPAKPVAPAPGLLVEDTVVLGPDVRAIPGVNPTTRLRFRAPGARTVALAGAWDYWAKPHPMTQRNGDWELEIGGLGLQLGRYEFKFVTNGVWEAGDNRILYVNLDGLLERPPDLIFSARQEAPTRIDVLFRRDVPRTDAVRARLIPDAPVARLVWREARGVHGTCGYSVAGDFVTFYMDEKFYDVNVSTGELVAVAGTFNGWRTDGVLGLWQLHDGDDDGVWSATVRMEGVGAGTLKDDLFFKFVINRQRWLQPRAESPNARSDGKGSLNLEIDPQLSASTILEVHTVEPLELSKHFMVVLEGLEAKSAFREVSPGAVLDAVQSTRELGVVLGAGGATFRLFAPRASGVEVHLYDGPYYKSANGGADIAPRRVEPMTRGDDGVWEVRVAGVGAGQYYVYRVEGPAGAGEGFNPLGRLGDPYARAMAHGDNNSLVIDPAATNGWFRGWTDQGYRTPAMSELVIYEAHVRDLTHDASSRVPAGLRGKYAGMLATAGLGTGLGHLKALGVNTIELMPTAEFSNGEDRYDWGYGPAFYFAPEASYARDPLKGSQYFEFKTLINELHRQGFAVVLDVVYNHIGSPNVFFMLDRKYYFRQDQDYTLQNFSACGNDVRSEAPMMRRLIIDNLLYWIREHHVDGFRFDLAELIDMETMLAIQDAVRAEKPDAILISEPWSLRGDHKKKLKGTSWSSWNDGFRWAAQNFSKGEGNREDLRTQLRGCVDTWAATPAQAINFLESHDDKALADMLTTDGGGDGRKLKPLDAARNRLAATILFTALGVPMISEGQEWMRSKHGFHNTFDRGDAVNALRWQERERPEAAVTLGYYRDLIQLRQSKAGATFRFQGASFAKATPVTEAEGGRFPELAKALREGAKTGVPEDYFWWIWPEDGRAFGYIMNWTRKYPGKPFMVLLNGADQPVTFDMTLPEGIAWQAIGDGKRIARLGIPGMVLEAAGEGKRTVTVPAVSAYIFVGM